MKSSVSSLAIVASLSLLPLSSARAAELASSSDTLFDTIIVTASRIAQSVRDIPAAVEVVSQEDLERTPALFITDTLKKNASVDVIQYAGGLSGVGMRGIRPAFSGVNQRVLILVDGRPIGATSMGNIATAGLARVEVVKGSASSIYGPSAMGGVVNFITRKSEGEIGGDVSIGYGSFKTSKAAANLGGAISEEFSFDLGLSRIGQDGDFRMGKGGQTYGSFVQGSGQIRPNTEFRSYNGFARAGWKFADGWELQARVLGYKDPDKESPGPETDGIASWQDKTESNIGGDVGLSGSFGEHKLQALYYATQEKSETRIKPPNTREYVSNIRDTQFLGVQAQDNWSFAEGYELIVGGEYGFVESQSLTFLTSGAQTGSSTPFFERVNFGGFADLTARWFSDRLILNVGGRFDSIKSNVLASPLRTDLTAGSSTFGTFNPRTGFVFRPNASSPIRFHGSAGTGFVVPDANQVAGLTSQVVSGQVREVQGNPDLKPESSKSFDIGVGYDGRLLGADLTWFRMDISDRIANVFTINTTALRRTTYQNALGSRAEGLEAEGYLDIGGLAGAEPGTWKVDASLTYYTKREEELATGVRTLNNVAKFKFNVGLGYDDGKRGLKFSARHVTGMEDQDNSIRRVFTNGAGGQFEYPNFTIFDITSRWEVVPGQQISLKLENLTNEFYIEKGDYPLAGRSVLVEYRYSF